MIVRGVCGVSMMMWAVAASATVPTRGFAVGESAAWPVQAAFQRRLELAPPVFGPWVAGGFAAPCLAGRAGALVADDCSDVAAIALADRRSTAPDVLEQLRLPTLPEADLWLQLLTGFGLAGFVVRLRRVGIETVVA